jgi:cytoskeletal protein CcmA (bactofilin family)
VLIAHRHFGTPGCATCECQSCAESKDANTFHDEGYRSITVRERCELHACSQLIGDIKAVRLVVEGGATLMGKSQVTPIRGAIKDVAVAQGVEPQEIGSPR